MGKEAKLGLFVLVVFSVFLFFTVNMGSGLLAGKKRMYHVYFTNMGTLEKGAPVKQAGFDVGEVSGISLKTIMEPTPTFYIVADVNLNESAHIAYDSKATIQTMGMMGEKYIEISFGQREEAPENSRIDGQGPQQLDQVMASANDAIVQVRKILESLNFIFADEAFQKNIVQLITNLEQFSREVNDLLGGQEERLKNILSNTQLASANLNTMIASAELFVADARSMINENRPYVKRTMENTSVLTTSLREELPGNLKKITDQFDTLGQKLNQSMKNTDQLIAKLDTMISENQPDIRETINHLKEFSVNAKTASDRVNHLITNIDEGEGLVHDLIYDRELSQSTKRTVSQASDVLGSVSDIPSRFSFELDSRYFSDRRRFDSDDSHARVDAGVRFAMNDNLSLYLGGNSLGTANDFEGQIGYRVGPITFHGGMIESEIGLGADWQIFDRWMVGLEGVGLTDSDEERLDAYTEFLIWKHFYLVGGVQDVTDNCYPNLGLKMRF